MALRGGGECGALLRALDWDENPLGRPETWPPELRTVVSIALGSQQPMLIVWGPQQITLYNDGYAVMCGNRHPQALGRPFRDLWFDIWDQVDPIISAAYNGVSTAMDDIEFIMHRKGYPEETHFAFSYTPVRDSDGVVLGMFCACVETTAQVTMQKRLTRERAQMQHVFEMALGAVAILDGPDHVVTFTNREYEMLAGRGGLVGKPLVVSLPEAADQGFIERLDQVYKSGQPYIGRNAPVEIQPVPSGPKQTRTIDFLYHPVHEVDGRVGGIFVQVLDVTERAGAERQQKVAQSRA